MPKPSTPAWRGGCWRRCWADTRGGPVPALGGWNVPGSRVILVDRPAVVPAPVFWSPPMMSLLKQTAVVVAALASLGAQATTTIYANDFNGAVPEWSVGSHVTQLFGGGYWFNDTVSGGQSLVTQASFSVGAGTSVSGAVLNLLFGAIDTWDGGPNFGPDTFVIKVDGNTVFSAVVENYMGTGLTSVWPSGSATTVVAANAGVNFLGAGYNDSAYTLAVPIGSLTEGAHTMTFQVIGGGWQGGSDESFALDNVSITGTVTPVPEAGTAAMLAAGLCAMSLLRRRRVR